MWLRVFVLCGLVVMAAESWAAMPCAVNDKARAERWLAFAGEAEAAKLCGFALRLENALREDRYETWKSLAVREAEMDRRFGFMAYLKAWQQAGTLDQAEIYRDFMQIKPDSKFNLHAIHALFLLAQREDKIKAYWRFIKDFPDTPEAVQALLRMHELAFEKARKEDTPEIYDAFVSMFEDARQVPEAIEAAFVAEKKKISEILDGKCAKGFDDLDKQSKICDDTANFLLNDMLNDDSNISDFTKRRKYKLLRLDFFKATQAANQAMMHKEVISRFDKLEVKLAEYDKNLNDMKEALIQIIQAEHQQLANLVSSQGQEIKDVLWKHNEEMKRQFVNVNQYLKTIDAGVRQNNRQLQTIGSEINSLQNQMVVESVLEAIPFGKLAAPLSRPLAKLLGTQTAKVASVFEAGARGTALIVTEEVTKLLEN